MQRFLSVFLLAAFFAAPVSAQTDSSSAPPTAPAPTAKPSTPAAMQSALDTLTQNNRDLINLLKQEQAVLEDIQYDRRLQSRQIQLVEERLVESVQDNAKLEAKIASLEAAASVAPSAPVTAAPTPGQPAPAPAPVVADPPPPSTYLPPPSPDGAPGVKSWHRLFTLSGTDSKTSDVFPIEGSQWRVLWHNLDKPGKAYANTSALFINAFPRDDTIPLKVCSKLGTGGDVTPLAGRGNYYLKIEASGGSWECAVEDFR